MTLISNITFGGPICPTPTVEFTCTAVDATFVEWQRNGVEISSFQPDDTVGDNGDPRIIPSGFEIELTEVNQGNQQNTANFTTILIANLSALINGSDWITCRFLGEKDSINISYTGQRCKI